MTSGGNSFKAFP